MNVLGTISSSQSKFVTRYSYYRWFNGTNEDSLGMADKLTESDWTIYGIDSIALLFGSITINGIYYDELNGNALFYGESYEDYIYRNDGYGLGVVSYIDPLNTILAQYQLRTRFYPAAGNAIVGIINTAENFEVSVPEFASGPDVQTDYIIKCEYGNVYDSIDGGQNFSEWQ